MAPGYAGETMVEPPSTPVQHALRGDYSRAATDYTVAQEWQGYSQEQHAIWAALYRRQIDRALRGAGVSGRNPKPRCLAIDYTAL